MAWHHAVIAGVLGWRSEDDVKAAIITEIDSGIGQASALRLAREGFRILGLSASAPAVARFTALMPDACALCLDLTSVDAPSKSIAAAMDAFGRLDAIVNIAVASGGDDLLGTTDRDLDDLIAQLVRAPFRMVREALPVLQSGSAIVNVISPLAVVGGADHGASGIMHAALVGLTTHLAVQYGPRGIRSNAVAVMAEDASERHSADAVLLAAMTPATRLGNAGDAANAIAYLASSRAGFINGQVLTVDGGWSGTRRIVKPGGGYASYV